jgi:hypothetical protein
MAIYVGSSTAARLTDNVIIEGNIIEGNGATHDVQYGILILGDGTTNVQVTGNHVIAGTGEGITLNTLGSVFVSNNVVTGSVVGVRILKGTGDTIMNNRINCTNGIYIATANCNSAYISNNNTTGSATAISTTNAVTPKAMTIEGATATIADGGTITHGLGFTPTWVIATPSVASEFVSVTAIGATTFTVAIKDNSGNVGTTQTIYWRCGT